MEKLFLGIDGGQSHTEAVIADEHGHILGRGWGGPSNHAEQPGGRERLQNAVFESVSAALSLARLPQFTEISFAVAYCAMSGGADYKEEIIGGLINADKLVVAHDAPAALAGATGGQPGIVVIAGTGSVAYGENEAGENAQAGGWGHLFSDEGSGYWIAAQAIKRALRAQDRGFQTQPGEPVNGSNTLQSLALSHFGQADLRSLTLAVYGAQISRDELAAFAKIVHQAALEGAHEAGQIIREGSAALFLLASTVARRLLLTTPTIVCSGGVWRGELVRSEFAKMCVRQWPQTNIAPALFSPAMGALLLAYQNGGIAIDDEVLANLTAGGAEAQ